MKAFLLAAGLGTRLNHLTQKMPKCLMPIGGRPLIGWWLDLMVKHGITRIIVNTHHLSGQVRTYVEGCGVSPMIRLFHEEALLGTAGTVKANEFWLQKDAKETFLVAYADNLSNINLSHLIAQHIRTDAMVTMGLFRVENPSECGIVELDPDGKVVGFQEKPEHPTSNLANAGVYVMNTDVLEWIPPFRVLDFGHDVFPCLVDHMFPIYGVEVSGYHRDIGTPKGYAKAQEEWAQIMPRVF